MTRLKRLGRKFVAIQILRRLQVQKRIRGNEIFKGQFPILELICNNEGCTQKFLADHLMVSQASIALSVKRLVKAGLLEKRVDEENMRCNQVFSTEKGRQVKNELAEKLDEIDELFFSGFSEEELVTMDDWFTRIIENLGAEPEISLCALRKELMDTQESKKGGMDE